MARTLHYKILDHPVDKLTDREWEEISRLQHWYNSEFIWTAGRLALKMFAVFPNWDHYDGDEPALMDRIRRRQRELRMAGYSENQIILQLQEDGLVTAKQGGYMDHCLASGFTKVAANEFNAYLVCEFLLKASTIAPTSKFSVYDEGRFIKTSRVIISNGDILVPQSEVEGDREKLELIKLRRVFSIVNPAKYDNFPKFRTLVAGYNDLDLAEKLEILRDWNWLGFGENYDLNGDDIQGYDLNSKVSRFWVDTN